jgi:hypothetical protein
MQARRGDDHYRLHLGITEQIYILTIVAHIMFAGEGRATQRILPTYGIQFRALHIMHEMPSIAHAVRAHANQSKADGSHYDSPR